MANPRGKVKCTFVKGAHLADADHLFNAGLEGVPTEGKGSVRPAPKHPYVSMLVAAALGAGLGSLMSPRSRAATP